MITNVFLGTNDKDRASTSYAPIMSELGWCRRLSEIPTDLALWNPTDTAQPRSVLGLPSEREFMTFTQRSFA